MSIRALALLIACALPGLARADGPPPPGPDPIGSRLFPPELIMGHQQELGIDDKQRDAIIAEVQALQKSVVPIQWQMQASAQELGKVLDAPRIDEARALAQADKVMGLERDVKRTHLGALIRIRNLLTDAQRAKLAALRASQKP